MDKLFDKNKNFAKSRETKSPEDIFIEDDKILCEANALTSVLVDFIHGKHKQNRQHRDLLEDIIDLSIYYIGEIEKLDSNNSKRKYYFWHNLCRLRRIVSILNKAINQEYIDYDDNISKIMIIDLVNLKSKLNAIVKAEAYTIAKKIEENSNGSNGPDIDWTDVAIIYESTLYLRHSALAGTLALTNLALSIKKNPQKDPSEDEFIPNIGKGVYGLMSFNPIIFNFELSNLIGFSKAITVNSSNAAAQGILNTHSNFADLNSKFLLIGKFLIKYSNQIKLSSILHIESALRVASHNLAWFRLRDENGATLSRIAIIRKYLRYVQLLEEAISNEQNSNIDEGLRHFIESKIQQDSGILLANILPFHQLEQYSQQELKSVTDKDISKRDFLNKCSQYLDKGWKDTRDRPVIMRSEFYNSIKENMKYRVKDFEQDITLVGSIDSWIGEPNRVNPLREGSTIKFLFTKNSKSKHLKHFPQSKVNQSQISLSLAYMSYLSTNPDKFGLFSRLEEIIETTFRNYNPEKRLKISSKISARPQFTIGHFKDDKENKTRKTRENLTRINRMDTMMYLGNTLSKLDELIKTVLRNFNPQEIFDSSARQCNFNLNDFIPQDYHLHIHEILNSIDDLSQSPMRILNKGIKRMDPKERRLYLTDQIFRTSFSRLYILALKTEQIARILIQRPLRQPFLSSAVLAIDQVRVLLDFLYEDWLKSSSKFYSDNKDNIKVTKIDPSKVEEFNKYLGRSKPFFESKNIRKDRDNVLKYSDISLEYIISNSITLEEINKAIENTKGNLNFDKYLGESWKTLLDNSLHIKYDLPGNCELDDILENLKENLFPSADKNKKDIPWLEHPDEELVYVFEEMKQKTEKEWLLWGRLAFLPTSFDGRIIVSSTTFKEINQGEHKINKSINQNGAESLVWGKVYETYQKFWETDIRD